MSDQDERGFMERHGFKVMSDAEKKRRTVEPKERTVAGRLAGYRRAIETVRASQEKPRSDK